MSYYPIGTALRNYFSINPVSYHPKFIAHSSPPDDEWSAEVVLSDALCLLVAVGGGLADAAQAAQSDVVVLGRALPLLTCRGIK